MSRNTIWVCAACGKTSKKRQDFDDGSCYLNSVKVYADSIQFDEAGRVIYADAVEPTKRKDTDHANQ